MHLMESSSLAAAVALPFDAYSHLVGSSSSAVVVAVVAVLVVVAVVDQKALATVPGNSFDGISCARMLVNGPKSFVAKVVFVVVDSLEFAFDEWFE